MHPAFIAPYRLRGDERYCIRFFAGVSFAAFVLATHSTDLLPCISHSTSPNRTHRGPRATACSIARRRSAVASTFCTRRTDSLYHGRSVAPISRGTRTPSVNHRGRFRFSVRKGKPEPITRVHAPKHPRGKGLSRRGAYSSAVSRCFGTGGRSWNRRPGRLRPNPLPIGDSRQYEASDETNDSGTGSQPVRCARRCRGVCRRAWMDVSQTDGSSAW